MIGRRLGLGGLAGLVIGGLVIALLTAFHVDSGRASTRAAESGAPLPR